MVGRRSALILAIWFVAGLDLAAADALADAFAGSDPAAWSRAVQVAVRNDGLENTARRLAPWLVDRRDGVALLAWSVTADCRPPPVSAVVAGLARSSVRRVAARCLPGIASPDLVPMLAAATADRDPEVARPAMAALTFAGPATAARDAARRALGATDAGVRARAAEWFRWHGLPEDLAALDRRERDSEVAAVVAAARATISGRGRVISPAVGPATWFLYGGSDVPAHDAAAALAERLAAQLVPVADPSAAATTGAVVDPVAGFVSDRPGCFGLRIAEGPYGGRVHVGHDTAWYQAGAPVRAVLDGIVRTASPALPSWGGLVVVEHQGPDGAVCSLYGHLGLLLAVRPGCRVSAGQLLGTLGRTMSPENGGYVAHLHFGLHRGDFGDGLWVRGYLRDESPAAAGWLDPVPTIATWRARR